MLPSPHNLHHANLLIGGAQEAQSHLRLLCKNLGVTLANNPDFFPFRMGTFGIDEARELKSLAARKALGSKKIFFITSPYLTAEAQNALLKIFEDPFPDTYFFVVAREEALIVPTLLSRMQTLRLGASSDLLKPENFLSLPIKDRLLFAKKFADDEESLPDFLDNLLLLLRKHKASIESIENVYNLRRFAFGSAVLPRLIIEHLSLVL